MAGGASLVLAKESRNKEAAWKLIEFLAEPAQQLEFYRQTGDLPPRKTTWEAAELAADAEAQAFRIQLEHVLPLPKIPEWERIAAKISHYAERAIRGELTAGQALQSLDHDVDTILEKRRWLLERAPD
ncbi:MAG: extracellular solute-binding protein [Methylotetracoccus sp.]|nr:extracellular solute-binding protein [Methylotetracoccus sp.]